MSITDATGTTDTAWTEVDVVSFTAGTLNTVNDLVCEVQDNLKRGTLSGTTTPSTTQVQRWLIRAKEYFASLKNFQSSTRYATASGTAGSYIFSMPADYRGGEVTIRDVTGNQQPINIEIIPATTFDKLYPNPGYSANGQATPQICTVKNMRLIFHKPLDGAYTLELQYARSGDDNTTTDFSWLPEPYRFMICDYAIYRSFMSLHQWDAAQLYKAEWMDAVKLMRVSDGKHKAGQTMYQCPVWVS